MARLIDFGQPHGVVSFPDDATDEQIVADYDAITKPALRAADLATPPSPSVGDYAKQVGGSFLRGAGGTIAAIPEGLGIARETAEQLIPGAKYLDALRGVETLTGTSANRLLRRAGEGIRSATEAVSPDNPQLQQSFLATKVPGALGSALAFMAGGEVGAALKIPRWLSIGGLGSLTSGSDFYNDAKASGADDDTARIASVVGNVVGTSEAIPLAKMMHRLDGLSGGAFSKYVIEAGKDTLEEALQEGAQQLAQNFTAQQLYDKDRSLFEDVAGNAGAGGVTGALASALTQALGIRANRQQMRRGEAVRRNIISQEVEQGRLLPQPGAQNAKSIGVSTETGSQEEGLRQEENGGLRVRGTTENGVETQTGTTITPGDVIRVSDDITSKWLNSPPIMVVETPDQLPEEVKASAQSQNLNLPGAAGVVDNQGRIWLVSGNLNGPEHARRIILHEAVGHIGVDSVFGSPEEFTAFMQAAAERHADTELGNQIRSIYGNDPVTVGREVIAKLAENPQQDPTLWQRIVAYVRNWARKVFNLEVTDNDIKVLLRRGRTAMEEGEGRKAGVPAEAQAAFAKENLQEAPVVYKGFQKGIAHIPGVDLYNLTDTIHPQLVKSSTVTEARLNELGFKVPDVEKAKADAARPADTMFAIERPSAPQFFNTRQQVETALQDPLLKPAQISAARDLAEVQSSMTSDNIAATLFASPKDDAERYAQKKLEYLQDRRFLGDIQKWFTSLPETNNVEKQAKEVAASVVLGHYGVDRQVEREINTELETDQQAMTEAVKKIGKLTNQQIKANFLTGLFNHMVSDYREYLNKLGSMLPASQNAQAQYRQRLADAERRLNEQAASPIALQRALSEMAVHLPDTLLAPGTTNQQIIDWVVTHNTLQGVVGQQVRDWMLVDDGSGSPALLGYTRLLDDMNGLRDVLAHQNTLANDVRAFEQWFRQSGKTGKIPAKLFAEKYFQFRTARDRAAKLAGAMEKQIEDLDTRIRGNIQAKRLLSDLMTSPKYVESVRAAGESADVVVRALYEGGQKTGLIERDKTVGLWRMKGPTTGTEYIVDLHPSATIESQNQGNLKAFAQEARDYAATNADTDPLLADEYNRLADYIDRFMVHPALNPNQGFTQLPWIRIPGTTIRINTDVYGWTAKTIRDVLEKVGGRTARQAVLDANELDTVMRKVDGINNHPTYGYAAQTRSILKALASHGWTPEQFPQWDERISERVIAAGQNNLGPSYEVGDTVVGSGGLKLTTEDANALKLMKQWEDAVLKAAPKYIQDKIGDLGILRKAISSGRWAMARTQAPWVHNFLVEWEKAGTDAEKWKLLDHDTRFRRVLMGYIGEFNPEFQKMNKASTQATPFYDIFRLMARYEKDGVQTFANVNQVLDFMATEMVSRNMAPDQVTAKKKAQETLMADMNGFIKTFQDEVVGRKPDDVWGAVPPAIVSAATARNSFTVPRGNLIAPSTFYTYSRASDGSRAHYVGSLRSLMNLKLLQSSYEMRRSLEAGKARMDQRVDDLMMAGVPRAEAKAEMIKETEKSRKASELRYDYFETINALSLLEKAFDELARFEKSTSEHYQHGGVAALLNVFGTLKTSLLSSAQAIATNYWSGVMLGPALVHVQTGRIAKAVTDFVLEPHFWSALYSRLAAMMVNNKGMSKLLTKHAPMWSSMAKSIINAAEDWRRVEEIAQASGMVSPYNIKDVLANKKALKTTAGRLESEDEVLKRGVAFTNYIMSQAGPRHLIESARATTPRFFDNLINYTLIIAFDHETDFLKKVGWNAFKNREAQAVRTGTDYTDLSNANNILQPGDLGLSSWKALNRYREIFAGLGSLDQVLLDFYERTKSMSPQQRRDEPLIQDMSDHAAVALQYAAITNVATESNRPFLFKGKGSDGVWRNVAGTFMGWPINMAKQLSKVIQSHSKDKDFNKYAENMIAVAAMVTLFALGGAWNWEFGDELTEKLYGQHSARIQLGNVINAAKQGDYKTAFLYYVQALVNTVPYIGPQLGNMLGVSYTGRGNFFDATSWNPVLGWISDTWNTGKRVAQTGDLTLPAADYIRRWVPLSRAVINRLPIMRGLVDQQNTVRSLNASAPPGVEIKWGQKGGGPDARYSPANDEIQKLIASAYEAIAHGGSMEQVQQRYQDAINAYVQTGKSEKEAEKLVAASLASKEPIRILTGREMTPDEEVKWLERMTPQQKQDYERAQAAWGILSNITGKNMDFVNPGHGAGGGGGGGGGGNLVGARPLAGGSFGSRGRSRSSRTRLLRSSTRLRSPRLARPRAGRLRTRSRRLI